MMKPIKWIALLAIVVVALGGCKKKEEPFDPSQIYGLWKVEGSHGQYMRFLTAEQEPKDGEYYFAREWNEEQDVKEKDLKYKGQGWFKWKLDERTITTIHLLDNGSLDLPKVYTIVKLTSGELVWKDSYGSQVTRIKQ